MININTKTLSNAASSNFIPEGNTKNKYSFTETGITDQTEEALIQYLVNTSKLKFQGSLLKQYAGSGGRLSQSQWTVLLGKCNTLNLTKRFS